MLDIKMGNPGIIWDSSLERDIRAIIQSGWVSIGEWVEALEGRFKEETGCKHAIATNSATTGLIIAIKAAGWINRTVHMPAFTWPSTLYAVKCNNNKPYFHDIDRNSWLMENDFSHDMLGGCVIPVDIFGNEAGIPNYPKENIIIDAAHGFGLPNLGKRGIAEVVSLSFTKVLTAMEGGIILTDNDKLAELATELRRLSGRMGEINARIALQSFESYEEAASRRNRIISRYWSCLEIDCTGQETKLGTNNSVFSIMFKETVARNAVMKALAKNGVETKVYYDPLCGRLLNTDYIYNHILSLPIHNGVTATDVDNICKIINTSAEATPGKNYLMDKRANVGGKE